MHPIKPRLELQPDFEEGKSSWDCWAVKILGAGGGADFGGLDVEPGERGSSFKPVCVAMIKWEKLKRLSFFFFFFERLRTELGPSQSVIFCEACWGVDVGVGGRGEWGKDGNIREFVGDIKQLVWVRAAVWPLSSRWTLLLVCVVAPSLDEQSVCSKFLFVDNFDD